MRIALALNKAGPPGSPRTAAFGTPGGFVQLGDLLGNVGGELFGVSDSSGICEKTEVDFPL